MNWVSVTMAAFALLGAADRILGNKFGLGKEFEKGFMLLGTMALSMIGMIIISPVIARFLAPVLQVLYNTFGIDPSMIPASLFANDMGGAALAKSVAQNEQVGMFNALVVSSMMGCTVSFTIPYALASLNKDKHKQLILGLLCGIITIPVGCFAAGLIADIPFGLRILNLLPLLIFSLLLAAALLLFPNASIKVFSVVGGFIKILITIGLGLGILKFLTGLEPIKGIADVNEAALICVNAAIVMSGAFPMLHILSKVLARPMEALGRRLKISDHAALGFVATLANNVTTFEMMNTMDAKGVVLNAAFAVSASFTVADHLAFTLAFDAAYLPHMVLGKLVSGLSAVIFAVMIYKRMAASVTMHSA